MSGLAIKALGAVAAYSLLSASYRFTHVEGAAPFDRLAAEPRSIIVGFWHSRILVCSRYVEVFLYRQRGLTPHVLVSRSRDGELIARWIERSGGTTSRGSSTRGASAALRDMVRIARQERRVLVTTPDGPRGPARQVQSGTLLLAQLGGLPIYPMSSAAERSWRLRSWDRFVIPRPFSRVSVVVGEPLTVPADADAAQRERLRLELELALQRADARAAELCGVEP